MTQTEHEGRLYINGKFRDARSGRRYDVINPADESVVSTAADADADDVSDAIAAARKTADETTWAHGPCVPASLPRAVAIGTAQGV